MIGTEGQYFFQFNLNNQEDFLQDTELEYFKVVEEAGNVIPTFEMVFSFIGDDLLASLNEGNEFEVMFGKIKEDLTTTALNITNLKSAPRGSNKRIVELTGFLGSLPYITETRTRAFEGKSSDVIQAVAEEVFLPTSNVEIDPSQSDEQIWLQYGIRDKTFITNTWLHANYGSSFPVIGISMDNRFMMKDFKKLISKPYNWRFTNLVEDWEKDIQTDGDTSVRSRAGFINHWLGYGRKKLEYNHDVGDSEILTDEVKNMLAITKGLSRRADIEERLTRVGIRNENMHKKYWRSYLWNVTNLAVFSSLRLAVTFSGWYKEIRVLDLIQYFDPKQDAIEYALNDYYSGLYIATKVVRTLSAKKLITSVDICRESMNELEGQIR